MFVEAVPFPVVQFRANRSTSAPRGGLHRVFSATLIALLGMGALLSAACTSVGPVELASTAPIEPPSEAFDALPTVQLITPWGSAGSAIRLDERTFLTARHVLPRRGDQIELRGQMVPFERLASGEGKGTVNDWALIRVNDAPRVLDRADTPFKSPAVDPTARIREDARMYLVGFWRGVSPWLSRTKLRSLESSIFSAKVVSIADTPAFPSRDFIYLQTEAGEVFPGASGGPAVVWDRQSRRLVVVGIYVGSGEYTQAFGGSGGKVQIIRRIPVAAMEAWRKDQGGRADAGPTTRDTTLSSRPATGG